MDGALTGRDAQMALGTMMRLGALEARFDWRRVRRALRSSFGRARIHAGVTALRRRAVSPRTAEAGVRSPRRLAARHAPAGRRRAVPERPVRPGRAG